MTQKRKYLTQNEVGLILEASRTSRNPERDHCLVYMIFLHGFRVSEALALKLSDIDLTEGCLYIHRLKQGFSTTHPLLGNEIQVIHKWMNVRKTMRGATDDWLFLSNRGTPMTRQRVYQLIRKLGEVAGISVCPHPHMLRHACGFALADRGIDTRLIQDYLGHQNIRHTVHYTASNASRFEGVWQLKKRRKMLHLGPNCN
jgi:type 1 fimbriae regulatory protein FimB